MYRMTDVGRLQLTAATILHFPSRPRSYLHSHLTHGHNPTRSSSTRGGLKAELKVDITAELKREVMGEVMAEINATWARLGRLMQP